MISPRPSPQRGYGMQGSDSHPRWAPLKIGDSGLVSLFRHSFPFAARARANVGAKGGTTAT